MTAPRIGWSGVFPAATTQFKPDLTIDYGATQRMQDALVNDGVDGLVIMGTVGEGNSLDAEEKRKMIAATVEAARGRVPVIVGVSELTTPRGVALSQDAERLGASGLMVLPAMVYVPTEEELVTHFRTIAEATKLPIMLYNNPPAYRVSISCETLKHLSALKNVVCIKESAPDTRRFTDIANAVGDGLVMFAGLDDVALEGAVLGAQGWVSGLTNAFPKESLALWRAATTGDLAKARAIYRWFMPMLHLDAEHDLVQSIKLAEQIMGRGSERVRPPRHPLTGARRAYVTEIVETAAARRPKL